MTNNEIMVSIVGALLGYWAISVMTADKGNLHKKNSAERPNTEVPEGESEPPYEEHKHGAQSSNDIHTQETIQTWYEVLEVSKNASLDEVQTAYRSLIRQYHPDKVASLGNELKDLAERKSKSINQAYNDALKVVGSRQ